MIMNAHNPPYGLLSWYHDHAHDLFFHILFFEQVLSGWRSTWLRCSSSSTGWTFLLVLKTRFSRRFRTSQPFKSRGMKTTSTFWRGRLRIKTQSRQRHLSLTSSASIFDQACRSMQHPQSCTNISLSECESEQYVWFGEHVLNITRSCSITLNMVVHVMHCFIGQFGCGMNLHSRLYVDKQSCMMWNLLCVAVCCCVSQLENECFVDWHDVVVFSDFAWCVFFCNEFRVGSAKLCVFEARLWFLSRFASPEYQWSKLCFIDAQQPKSWVQTWNCLHDIAKFTKH